MTAFGGAVAVPSAVRSSDSTTTMRVNDVTMTRMDGASESTVSSAITPTLLVVGLGLSVPALLGQQLGFWLAERVSRETFRRVVLVLLFVAGLGLLRRGFAD